MLKLKTLRLKNFCQYIDHTFDFTKNKDNLETYQFICFFGFNGSGKSTILEAISLLTGDHGNRPIALIRNSLIKYVRSEDYDPTYTKLTILKNYEPQMLIEGVYVDNSREYIIRLNENGWTRNDFAPICPADSDEQEKNQRLESGPWGEDHLRFRRRICHSITSNSDLSLNRFQIHNDCTKQFKEIIEEITRYKVECLQSDYLGAANNKDYCTDMVLIKKNHRVHYKRMSMGEKKICKSFSEILNLMHALQNYNEQPMPGWPRILLLDELDAHVYYDRHVRFVDCMKNIFPEQQIFATTHSGILVPNFLQGNYDKDREKWFDLAEING